MSTPPVPPSDPDSAPGGKPGGGARDFLAMRGGMAGLMGMVILVGMGEKMAERFLPIYVMALGAGPIVIGLLGGMDNLLSALYSFPGGWLARRLGAKRALLVFNLIAMTGFLIVIVIPDWRAVLAGAVLFLSWTAISLPATMDLISRSVPKNKRTMGVSVHSFVRRIPMALGPVVGGFFIGIYGEATGVRIAFVAALTMAALGALLQQRLIRDDPPIPDDPGPEGKAGAGSGNGAQSGRARFVRLTGELLPGPLRNLLVSDILIRFCEQIPYAFVVVWCMKTISAPVTAVEFGILSTIEMVTAMLVYIPVAWLADRGTKKPFVLITFVNFTLFPVALLAGRSFWPLAAAFVLRGLKEFGEPSRKALIMDLAPEGRKAEAFGLYYLLRDMVVSVAAFGGAFLWRHDPALNLLAASAFGLAGTVWFALKGGNPQSSS